MSKNADLCYNNAMADTLLVGIDGGTPSGNAVAMAKRQAQAAGGKLLVVYVIEWSPYTFNTPEENEQRKKQYNEEISVAKERVLNPLLAEMEKEGVDAEGVVRHGSPAEIINLIAKERGAAQVFVGRRGAKGVKEMLFGSVTANLVQTSPVPVTVVP